MVKRMKEETIRKISYLLNMEVARTETDLKRSLQQGDEGKAQLVNYRIALLAHDDWKEFCDGEK